jgi:alanine racemase
MIPNEVIIDLDAIKQNFLEIRRLARPKAGIIAVIKSDAYGHGMIPVAKALEPEHPDYFGVFELQEAMDLRQAGCEVPILVMLGITGDETSEVVEKNLTVSLFQHDIAERLSRQALEKGRVVPVHIKVDTGMARLGVPWNQMTDFLKPLLPLKGIRLEGIFSHFAVSDDFGHCFTDMQLERFSEAVRHAWDLGVCKEAVHIANSGGVMGKKGLVASLVRPGLSLYGSPPADGLVLPISLKPAMTFRSRVVQVKTVPAGTPISYGGTYTTNERATIATIPVGYDDGFNRLLSNKGEVLIQGQRVPVVGRVCMNLTMVDVSSVGGVSVGDDVVLLGSQGRQRITPEEMAKKTGTIAYEVYCAIGKANPRRYVNTEG